MKYFVLLLLFAGCAPENVDWSKKEIDITLVQSESGSLKTPLNPKIEDEMDFTIQVPFARVIEPFRKIAHRKFWHLLQAHGASSRPDRATPVYNLQLGNYQGASLQYAYEVETLSTHVVALHEKNRGAYRERDLDTNKIVTRTSSRVFGKDLSLRYLAGSQGSGAFGLCLNLPGESLGADPASLRSSAQDLRAPDHVQPFVMKAESVAATFDFARACFSLPIGKPASSAEHETTVAAPQAIGPVLSSEFGELSEPLKMFYAEKFAKTENKSQEDFKGDEKQKAFLDGSWIIGERKSYLQETGSDLKAVLGEVFHRNAVPETSDQLQQVLMDTCRRLRLSESKAYTDDIDSFCRNELDGFKVESLALPDVESQKAGCYKGFTRVHETRNAQKVCQIDVRLHLTIKDKDLRKPLAELLKEFVAPAPAWATHVSELRVDPLELAVLIENWEAQGHSRVEERNWKSDFPALLEELREELATGA